MCWSQMRTSLSELGPERSEGSVNLLRPSLRSGSVSTLLGMSLGPSLRSGPKAEAEHWFVKRSASLTCTFICTVDFRRVLFTRWPWAYSLALKGGYLLPAHIYSMHLQFHEECCVLVVLL